MRFFNVDQRMFPSGLAGALAALALSLPLAACADNSDQASLKLGAVYAMTNQPTGNAIVAFRRTPNGTLIQAGTFSTGGRGRGAFDQSRNSVNPRTPSS